MVHKKIDKVGKVIVNTMMLGLLWAIIALPISSFSLVQLDTSSDVLSEQDVRTIEIQNYIEEEETKVMKEMERDLTDDSTNVKKP
ncbi:hypothetical protein ACFLZK_00030 [Patescibacteria group bacterium]